MRKLALTGIVLALASSSAVAGLQGPEGPKGVKVRTPEQRALIFWRNGQQELILQSEFTLTRQGKAPKQLVWVIPVPEAPLIIGTVNPEVFRDAFRLTARRQQTRLAGNKILAKRSRTPAIVDYISKEVTIGRYKVKTLKKRGDATAKDLNAYLRKRKIKPLPVESLSSYARRNWTFVVVEARAANAGDQGALKPLRLIFKSKDIVLPLKISSHMGAFRSKVSILTDRPLPLPTWLKKKGFKVTTRGNGQSPGSEQIVLANLEFNHRYWAKRAQLGKRHDRLAQKMLRAIKVKHPRARTVLFKLVTQQKKSPLGRFPNLWLTQLESSTMNGEGNHLEDWPDDFVIDMKDYGRRLSDQELELLGGGGRRSP